MKYTYNDIMIVPAEISDIKSRSECNPYYGNKLPIFTAPMSSIIDDNNYKDYQNNNIIPIIPRSTNIEYRLKFLNSNTWIALSFEEFLDHIFNSDKITDTSHILIDVANGHMKQLFDLAAKSKHRYGDKLKLMVGNIANPITAIEYIRIGVDYLRLGIGSGAGCITSSNTGIHYPMASLIKDTVEYLNNNLYPSIWRSKIKLIADGGIRNYSDVIKALALGADYVMIGGLFAQMEEASSEIYYKFDEYGNEIRYRKFYGMASSKGQIDLNGVKVKTSEGISKEVEIKYTLPQWTRNMADYLRSAMSYCNAKTLDEFKGSKTILISPNSINSINK